MAASLLVIASCSALGANKSGPAEDVVVVEKTAAYADGGRAREMGYDGTRVGGASSLGASRAAVSERDNVRSVGRATALPMSLHANSRGQVLDAFARSETCRDARNCEGGDARVTSDRMPMRKLSISNVRVTRPACADARRGLAFYQARARYWAHKRGQEAVSRRKAAGLSCPRLRLLAKHARQAAHAARVRYERWSYQWEWRRWLPAKWQRIGWCETHLNWRHWYSPSGYQGAFGFAPSSWDGYKDEADPKAGPYPADANQGTPRQQYEVALAIYRHFGFSGWGCRNA